jgi:creatinine amidohydrolase
MVHSTNRDTMVNQSLQKSKKPLKLEEQTWPKVEHYLQKSKKLVWPVGSTEQHGPSGILGVDFLSALKLAEAVSAETQIMMAPVIPVGMAVHHMNFPGTITFSPATYLLVLTELFQSLFKHGFEEIFVINGHGGNIAPITSAFSQCKQKEEIQVLKLINWWILPEVTAYEKKVFGDENGFHATCGEISVTRFTHPEAYEDVNFERLPLTTEAPHWPMSPSEFRAHYPAGNMGSQPVLSSADHGEKIFTLATDAIRKMVLK